MTAFDSAKQATVTDQNRSIEAVSQARQALAQARTVPEMKRIRSTAEAMAVLAFREGYFELSQQAKLLMLEAERAMGRWLKENVNHNGGNPDWSEYQGLPDGVSKKDSHYFQLEAALPEEKFRSWANSCIAGGEELNVWIFRKIAKKYVNGVDETEPMTFDSMKSKGLYWARLILKEYPARFPEFIRGIIAERKVGE